MIVTNWTMKAMRIPGGEGGKGEEDNPPEDLVR